MGNATAIALRFEEALRSGDIGQLTALTQSRRRTISSRSGRSRANG